MQLLKIFNFKRKNNYKDKSFLRELKIEQINLNQYTEIYNNNVFQNNSHIQSPGYYLDDEHTKYIKISIKKKNVALLSLIKKKLFFNFLHIARINQGPLITLDYIDKKNMILEEILHFIKHNYSRLISFAPPSIYKEDKLFRSFNCIKLRNFPYKTYLLNLIDSEEKIFRNLKGNWRNKLRKGMKSTYVEEVTEINKANKILLDYKNYSKRLGFQATSIEKCNSWFKNSINNKSLLHLKIYSSSKLNEPDNSYGSIGILCFKEKCLYLFGFTTNTGKRVQANTAMLWHSIIKLKEIGYKVFDLGGINEKSTKSILTFKKGLNGTLEESLGEYFYIGIL